MAVWTGRLPHPHPRRARRSGPSASSTPGSGAHRAARAARLAAARGLRLPRRHRALPLRRAQPDELERFALRDRRGAAAPAHEAARRGVQLGHRGGAAGAPAPHDGDDARGRRPRRRRARRRSSRSRPRATAAIGLLATPATVASGAYAEAVAAADPHVDARTRRLPRPRADHPGRLPVRRARRRDRARVLRAAARGRRRHRDPRLHPLPAGRADAPADARPRRQLVTSGAARRAPASSTRSRARGLGNPRDGEGDYRFLCTGDVEAFRALGTRFLQMPLGEVEQVELGARRRPHDARAANAPTAAPPGDCARSRSSRASCAPPPARR